MFVIHTDDEINGLWGGDREIHCVPAWTIEGCSVDGMELVRPSSEYDSVGGGGQGQVTRVPDIEGQRDEWPSLYIRVADIGDRGRERKGG